LDVKIKIWDIIIGIWESDESKLAELFEIYTIHEDHTIAKYVAFKRRKLAFSEKYEGRVT
jgi:hypothetical protein